MAGRAIIVHSLAEARAAVAAAAGLGLPVTLLSAEGAAASAGALWFRELVDLARAGHPEVEVTAILDCADKPGHALAALRHGLERLRFTGPRKTAATLQAIAAQQGAAIVTGRIAALDLLDHPDPEAACRDWLSRGARA